MNGDDSGRFPTRGEGVRGPRPVEKEKEGGVVLAKANALVKDRQSGQGQTQWKRRICRWQWRAQPRRRGSRRNCGGTDVRLW